MSAILSSAALLADLFGTGVHAGILVGVLAVVVTYVIVNKTRFEVTLVGSNPAVAMQAGMSTLKLYLVVFLLGGALAGFAGFTEIAGVQGRLSSKFSPGYGSPAIPVALLGQNGTFRVLLAVLFFALLFVGGQAWKWSTASGRRSLMLSTRL